MKKSLIIIKMVLFLLVFPILVFSADKSTVLHLNKNWKIQSSAKIIISGELICSEQFDTSNWYPTSVPKTVLAALVDNGIYPDPYYGDNLKTIPGYREGRWLSMPKDSPFYSSWWYRKEFDVPAEMSEKNLVLHFDGINYRANMWLNGKMIADTTKVLGMFRRFEFDINQYVRFDKENVLAVEVFAPGRVPDIKYRTKQIEATTGWDDHNPQPPDLNMGIWEDVFITATGPVAMRHPYVSTDLDLPSLGKAHLTVSVKLINKTDQQINSDLSGSIEDIYFKKPVKLAAWESKVVTFNPREYKQLNINNPRLWWPHPVGPQELYDLKLECIVEGKVSHQEIVRFGIREVSTYINDEGWRGYKINGKKILIRGGAWMTCDMMLNLTEKRYEALVRYAREANLNALRSEGFSIRETDEFYDQCDEYGVTVIQQIFGRSIPDEELAIQNIKDMILRIRNHPSLVHFLGHDETFPTKNLDKAYRDLIAQYTPERTYQPHSGAFNIKHRFKTGGTRTGTLELWTYANPSHYYTHKEDGAWGFAQSGGIGGIIAPFESVRKMMPEENLWPVQNDVFSFHTVLQSIEYYQELMDAMKNRYGVPKDIQEFCFKGQVINYESARGMFEAYARNKYDALGITTWKYDAAWPASITWQYVDWYLNVGGGYYGAKKACEPLHVQYSYDDFSIYVLNSYYESFKDLKVSAQIYNFDLTDKYSRSATVSVPEDGKIEAFKLELPSGLSKTYFLSLKLEDKNGKKLSDNFYWLSTIPDIEGKKGEGPTSNGWYQFRTEPKSQADFTDLQKLPKVKLETSYNFSERNEERVANVFVKNPTSYLAYMIQLAVTKDKNGDEVAPTFWSDNYFCLLPGESREITARFSKKDLTSANPVIRVDGWNIK